MNTSVTFPGDRLSLAELCAATLDGDMVALGEGFVPTDAPETPWLRAQSLAPMLAPAFAATHTLAAWVWGVIAECPSVLTIQRATRHRVNVYPRVRVVYRDGFVGDDDVAWFASVAVTTVERTVADLARVRDIATIKLIAFSYPDAINDAVAWHQNHTRLPGSSRAIALLERLT